MLSVETRIFAGAVTGTTSCARSTPQFHFLALLFAVKVDEVRTLTWVGYLLVEVLVYFMRRQ